MGILLVYDCTDESSFNNIRNWIRNIETHAADTVNKVLIGNKCDMLTDKAVDTTRGQVSFVNQWLFSFLPVFFSSR